MLTTLADVKRLTGYEVTQDTLIKAHALIEIYIGRVEDDIPTQQDRSMIARAVAFQCAYMNDNYEMIYEQIAAAVIGQNDSVTTFRSGDMAAPWIAPLAAMACSNLSWFKSRSVHTGAIFQVPDLVDPWRYN